MLCPICKKPVDEPKEGEAPSPHFPFCSDRCELVDLNRWLTGRYQVPAERDDPPRAAEPGEETA